MEFSGAANNVCYVETFWGIDLLSRNSAKHTNPEAGICITIMTRCANTDLRIIISHDDVSVGIKDLYRHIERLEGADRAKCVEWVLCRRNCR